MYDTHALRKMPLFVRNLMPFLGAAPFRLPKMPGDIKESGE